MIFHIASGGGGGGGGRGGKEISRSHGKQVIVNGQLLDNLGHDGQTHFGSGNSKALSDNSCFSENCVISLITLKSKTNDIGVGSWHRSCTKLKVNSVGNY